MFKFSFFLDIYIAQFLGEMSNDIQMGTTFKPLRLNSECPPPPPLPTPPPLLPPPSFPLLYQAAVTVEISILLICFCSFDLFCPLHDKDNYRKCVYCTVLLNSVLFKPVGGTLDLRGYVHALATPLAKTTTTPNPQHTQMVVYTPRYVHYIIARY